MADYISIASGDWSDGGIWSLDPPTVGNIIDNGDGGLSFVGGGWTSSGGEGYGSDIHFIAAGSGSNTATWNWTGLTASQNVVVALTWSSGSNRATNVPWTIFDSDGTTVLASGTINQENLPSGYTAGGRPFTGLAGVAPTGTTLSLRITDNANEFVIADAAGLITPAGAVPTSSDTVKIGVGTNVTVDSNVTHPDITVEGTLTVGTGDTLTLDGTFDVALGGSFVMAAGSHLVGDTTSADVVPLFAGSNTFTINGTNGSRCTVSKTGGNDFYFNKTSNSSSFQFSYCDFDDVTNSDGSLAFPLASGGGEDQLLDHCTFDECGIAFGGALDWDCSTGSDFIVDDCIFTNSTGADALTINSVQGGVAPAGTLRVSGCSFDVRFGGKQAQLNITECYIANGGGEGIGGPASFSGNFVNLDTNSETFGPNYDMLDCYLLADFVDPADRVSGVTGVGNPHFIQYNGASSLTFDGLIFEYPHTFAIDAGDGIFGTDDAPGSQPDWTIQRCLILPSMVDGEMSTNIHAITGATSDVIMHHNTIAGLGAQLIFNERVGPGSVAEVKSNLIAGAGGVGLYDLNSETHNNVDIVAPAGIKNNFFLDPATYTDPVTAAEYDGWRCRFSTPPDGTNIVESGTLAGLFVDPTRNFVQWGIHKGAVTDPEPGVAHTHIDWKTWKRDALDATHAYLAANPRLGATDLIPWVRAGFAPTNVALQDAGHDGVTIGAVEGVFAGGGGGPRRRRLLCGAR